MSPLCHSTTNQAKLDSTTPALAVVEKEGAQLGQRNHPIGKQLYSF